MKCVYIAHPLGSGRMREINRQAAALWVAWAAEQGECPMASWIVLASVWPETAEYRDLGLAVDFVQIEACDEVWLCGPRISPGMKLEFEHAQKKGIRVYDFTGATFEEATEMLAAIRRTP